MNVGHGVQSGKHLRRYVNPTVHQQAGSSGTTALATHPPYVSVAVVPQYFSESTQTVMPLPSQGVVVVGASGAGVMVVVESVGQGGSGNVGNGVHAGKHLC